MNKTATWIGAGIAGGIAAFIGTLVVISTTVFSGAGLSLLNGSQTDPHLLTRGIWHAIAQSCSLSTHCIGAWNVGGFASVCALVAYLAGYSMNARPAFAAALCGVIVATSPLAASLVISPLGMEIFVTLGLFAGIAASCARLWNPPPLVRLLLVVALVLQDPLYLPAGLLYTMIDRRRIALQAWSAAAVVLLFGVRLAAGSPPVWVLLHPGFDSWAAPPTIVLFGMVLFGLLPFALWLLAHNVDRAVGFHRANFFAPVALGAMAAAAALISSNDGDPAPYWLAGEISVILGFAAAVREDAAATVRQIGIALGALAIVLQGYEYPRAAAALPGVAISRESSELWSSLRSARASRTLVCVTGAERARTAVLGDGIFARSYKLPASQLRTSSAVVDCFAAAPTGSRIVAVGYPRPPDLSFALGEAARAASRSHYVLAQQNGTVYPTRPAAMPGGRGAYRSIVQTPLGPVPAFTVAAPFSYTFHCIRLSKSGVLSFAAANPLAGIPSAGLTRFSVLLEGKGSQKLLFSRDLPPTPGAQSLDWRFYTIPIGAIQCRSLTFKVSSLSSRSIGTWTAFAGLSIDRF